MEQLPDISEMEQIREDWLVECEPDIAKAIDIARELGDDYDLPYRSGKVKVFSFGDVHFIYLENVVKFLYEENDYLRKTGVVVTIGSEGGARALLNRIAVHYTTYNYSNYTHGDNFAVPRDEWVNVAKEYHYKALEAIDEKQQTERSLEQIKLAKKLWLLD